LRITDNAGNTKTLTIDSTTKTIGDVLTAIDQLGLALEARVNDAGDGILLIDNTAGGTLFKVTEGTGTSARDLSLLAKAKTVTLNGTQNQVIDGSSTYRIEISETDTLEDIASRVGELTTRVRASIFNDGSTVRPYRLTLASQSSGSAGELLWDTSEAGFAFEESINGQDALLQIGASGGGGVIASSSSGVFKELLADVSLTVKGESTEPVTVSIAPTQEDMIKAVKDFVDAYNKVRDKLNELTRFDETTQTAAILQGDNRMLRVQNDLDGLVSGRIVGAGTIQSLGAIGISLMEDGQLQFDENKLIQRFDESPAEVEEFFSLKEFGLSARFDKLIEQLAGVGDTVLVGRVGTLTRKIEQNQQRIDLWNARLEKQRERLLRSFERSETIIAKLQSSLSALNSIAPLPILQPAQ
jgi:flagellar hook-associated protein 2